MDYLHVGEYGSLFLSSLPRKVIMNIGTGKFYLNDGEFKEISLTEIKNSYMNRSSGECYYTIYPSIKWRPIEVNTRESIQRSIQKSRMIDEQLEIISRNWSPRNF